MRYNSNAYLGTNFVGLMEHLQTNDWSVVLDFIWRNCQNGLNCEIKDNETDMTWYAYAEDFTEDTIEPGELVRSTKKPDDLYADLRMEQTEQM